MGGKHVAMPSAAGRGRRSENPVRWPGHPQAASGFALGYGSVSASLSSPTTNPLPLQATETALIARSQEQVGAEAWGIGHGPKAYHFLPQAEG